MYLSLLQKLANGDALKSSDWKVVKQQLGAFLLQMNSNERLVDFFTIFPEAKELVDKNPDAYLDIAFNSTTAAFYDYLKERLPQDFNPWVYSQKKEYAPIFRAVVSGNKELIQHIIPQMREEDAASIAKSKGQKLSDFSWSLIVEHLTSEKLSTIAQAALELVTAVPEAYRTQLICRSNFALLNASMMGNDAKTFEQFMNLLPAGAVQSLIRTFDFQIAHATEGSRRGESFAILNAITEKIGAQNFVTAKRYEPRRKDRRRTQDDKDSFWLTPLGQMVFSHTRKPYPAEQLKMLLDQLPQEEVDKFLCANDFYAFRDATLLVLDDRFRIFYNALSEEKRSTLFEKESVQQAFKMLAYFEDDEIYHALSDLLPESYIKFFTEKRPTLVNPSHYDALKENYAKFLQRRKERNEIYQPEQLRNLTNHAEFNQVLYNELLPLAEKAKTLEQYHGDAKSIAAKLAILFENRMQVDHYLDRMIGGYGGEHPQCMHDAALFDIPQGSFNKPYWRKLIMDFGPAASRFLGLADKIEAYSNEHHIPLPQKPKEIAAIAQYVAYPRGKERPQLALACVLYGIPEDKFNRILDLLANQLTIKMQSGDKPITLKTNSLVPDIKIEGEDIGLPGFTMKKLDLISAMEGEIAKRSEHNELTPHEMAAILGKLSHCCQSIGDAGEKFTLHGMTSKHSDFYVWTKRMPDGAERVIAQSWAWIKDKKPKSITFDSIEPLGTAYNHIFTPFLEEFTKRIHQLGYQKVTIGKGGKTPKDLPFQTAHNPPRLNDFNFFATGAEYDSKEQWEVKVTGAPSIAAQETKR